MLETEVLMAQQGREQLCPKSEPESLRDVANECG